ncbi:MAG: hypothetical protein H0V63_14145, partial [Burkholderiaceae bacterium]|nr:hypothetical protein [Burkholderiaceae bacterium]
MDVRNYSAIFVLAIVLAFSFVVRAQRNLEPLPEEIANVVLNKREQIERELTTLQGNEWAGKYRANDGTTVTSFLDWSPTSGFTVWRENCSRPGIAWVNYGSANFNGNSLTLSPERTEKGQHTYTFSSPTLVPVKWDEQHWLIPSDQLILFAYAVNSGSVEEIETFFVKIEDYNKSNKGLPDLPKEYKKYLNAKPIRAKVSAVNAKDSDYPQLTELKLNVGKAKGVIAGMKFYLIGVKDRFASIEITEVQEHTSIARVG